MANNPDIQKRIRDEIKSVVSGARMVSVQDAVNLPYVEAAVLELMRVKPSVPLSLLHLTTEDTEVGGYFLFKKNTVVRIFTICIALALEFSLRCQFMILVLFSFQFSLHFCTICIRIFNSEFHSGLHCSCYSMFILFQ